MMSPKRSIAILFAVVMVTLGVFNSYGQNRYENSANYVSALKAIEENRYDDAYDFLSNEVAVHPDNGYAYILLTRFHFAVNDYEKAIESATEAINCLPANDKKSKSEAYVQRALAKARLDENESALDDFNKAVDMCPKETEFLLARAEFFNHVEKYDESDSDFRRVLALESDNANAQVGLGRNKIGRGEYQEAVNYFSRVLPNVSGISDAYAYRAVAYFGLEKYENCSADVVKALSIDGNDMAFKLLTDVAPKCLNSTIAKLEIEMQKSPKEPLWPFSIGIAYESSGKYSNAISSYKKAYQLNKDSNLAERISDCYVALGDYDNAKKYIDYAIELDAENADLYVSKAGISLNKKDYKDAVAQINKAIELGDKSADNYFLRGWIKELGEDFDGALEDYTECISSNFEYYPAYFNRGKIYKKRGYSDRARRDFEKCVELDNEPNEDSYAHFALAFLGRKDEAIAFTQKVLEKDSSASSLYSAACIYSLVDEKETAIEYLEKALKAGFRDYDQLMIDTDLDNIRGEEGYKKLVAQYITKTEYIEEGQRLKDYSASGDEEDERSNLDAPTKAEEPAEQAVASGQECQFNYTSTHGINKIAAELNGLPITINFINSNSGVHISVYEANFLLSNNYISSSDIIKQDPKVKGIPVGSTVVLHELVIGDITLTNIRVKVVTNDNVPFALGLKVFSSYTNITVKDGVVKMNKK